MSLRKSAGVGKNWPMALGLVAGSVVNPTLGALTLSKNIATVGVPFTATISGRTDGSGLALAGAGAAGLSIAGVTVSGTPTATGPIDVVETLANATNPSRTSSGVANTLAALTPATASFATSQPAGASILTFGGLQSGETVRRVSPNDGRIALKSDGTAALVGLTASSVGAKNYVFITSLGRRLTTAISATQALTPTQVAYTVTNPNASALTNYQVSLTVPYATGMAGDFSDLRVYAADGTTSIPFWIESYIPATSARIWFRPAALTASGTLGVVIGYGNASAAGGSDPLSVFEWGDTFAGNALDTTKWTGSSSGYGTQRSSQFNNFIAKQVYAATIPAGPGGGTNPIQSYATDGAGTHFVARAPSTGLGFIDVYTESSSGLVVSRSLTNAAPYHSPGMDFRPGSTATILSGGQTADTKQCYATEHRVSDGALVNSWTFPVDANFLYTGGVLFSADDGTGDFYFMTFDSTNGVGRLLRVVKVSLQSGGQYTVTGGPWNYSYPDFTVSAPQGACVYNGVIYMGVTDRPDGYGAKSQRINALTLNSDKTISFGPTLAIIPAESEIEGMQVDPTGTFWVCGTGDSYNHLFQVRQTDATGNVIITGGDASKKASIKSTATFGPGTALVVVAAEAGTYPGFGFADGAGDPIFSTGSLIGLARVSNSSATGMQLTPRVINAGTETRQTYYASMDMHATEVRWAADGVTFAQDGVALGAKVTTGIPAGPLNIVIGSSTSSSTTDGGAVFLRGAFIRQLAALEPTVTLGTPINLSVASVTPTPGQAFTTAITGIPNGATGTTATSSDGTPLSVSGSTLSGTWPLSTSGGNPDVTITVTKADGSTSQAVIRFAVAQLMDPSTIPGAPTLFNWMRADTNVTLASGKVASIDSRVAGGGIHTAPTTALQPTIANIPAMNNQPAIVFAGASLLTGGTTARGATNASPGMSESMVIQPKSVATQTYSQHSIVDSTSNRAGINISATPALTAVSRSVDTAAATSTAAAAGALVVDSVYSMAVEFNVPAGSVEIALNGTVVASGAIPQASTFAASASQAVFFGASQNNSGVTQSFAVANIAEKRIYRGVLTAAQKQMLAGYDFYRYGIAAPSGHPFASYPPTIMRLAKTTAKAGAAYSSQIAGFPVGATGYTATASDGTALAISSTGVVTGTFAAAGSVTVTLAATYNGVPLSGTSTVVVSA